MRKKDDKPVQSITEEGVTIIPRERKSQQAEIITYHFDPQVALMFLIYFYSSQFRRRTDTTRPAITHDPVGGPRIDILSPSTGIRATMVFQTHILATALNSFMEAAMEAAVEAEEKPQHSMEIAFEPEEKLQYSYISPHHKICESHRILENVPDKFLDPVSYHVMTHPMRVSVNLQLQPLEHEMLLHLLKINEPHPLSKEKFSKENLVADYELEAEIKTWIRSKISSKLTTEEMRVLSPWPTIETAFRLIVSEVTSNVEAKGEDSIHSQNPTVRSGLPDSFLTQPHGRPPQGSCSNRYGWLMRMRCGNPRSEEHPPGPGPGPTGGHSMQ